MHFNYNALFGAPSDATESEEGKTKIRKKKANHTPKKN